MIRDLKRLRNRKTARAVVRSVASRLAQRPVSAKGFACTPSVTRNNTSFTCVARDASTGGAVRLRFTLRYRPAS